MIAALGVLAAASGTSIIWVLVKGQDPAAFFKGILTGDLSDKSRIEWPDSVSPWFGGETPPPTVDGQPTTPKAPPSDPNSPGNWFTPGTGGSSTPPSSGTIYA